MRKSLAFWWLFGLTFTAVLGSLLHFLYSWTEWIALAPISAVNESTWEHMKILFFPMLIFCFIQYALYGNERVDFWQMKALGIVVGILLIPILFYTYNGAFGKSPDWLNVLFFFLSAALAYSVEWYLFRRKNAKICSPVGAIVLLSVLTVTFIVFTFFPPQIPLFKDPISGSYGLTLTK